MNNNEYNSQVFSKPVLKKISLSVNQVFMSFTGLTEVYQNKQSFHWKIGKTKNTKCLQIAPVGGQGDV